MSSPSNTPDQVPVATLDYEHSAVEQFVLQHSRKLIIVGAVALVGTLLYLGARMISESKESKSRIAFFQAKTVADLQTVARDHEGHPAAGTAMIDSARLLEKENRPGEAIEVLQKFLQKYSEPGSHPLQDFARFRLGDLLAASGRAADAESLYRVIVDGKGAFAARADLRLADALVAVGKKDEAKAIYERMDKNPNADPQIKSEAKNRLDLIKRSKPTVIPYVEPKPVTPEPNLGGLNAPPTGGGDPFGNGISLTDPASPEMKDAPSIETPPEAPPAGETPAADGTGAPKEDAPDASSTESPANPADPDSGDNK